MPFCNCFLSHITNILLKYRLVPYTRPADGSQGRRVQLYVMDLGSANGTFVNNNRIESQKYIQLLEKVTSGIQRFSSSKYFIYRMC